MMRSGFIRAFIILTVLASLAGIASAQIKGDINGDGKVNSLDALVTMKMAGNDANITPADARDILKISSGSGLIKAPALPIADFTMDFFPDTRSAFFNASLSRGGHLGYDWDFGDGQRGSGITIEHAYAGSGAFNVTLGVKDTYGRTNFTTKSLVILNISSGNHTFMNRTPIANFTVSPTRVAGEMVFDGSSSSEVNLSRGSTLTYAWNFGDGQTGSGAVVTHRYLRTGTYIVTLTVTDDAGRSDSSRAAVKIRSASGLTGKSISEDTGITISTGIVMANFTFDKPIPGEAGNLVMDASASLGDNLTYAWDLGDGTTDAGVRVVHMFAIPGTYDITLNVTDDAGLSDSMTRRMTFSNNTTADVVARFIGGPLNGTAPLIVKFNAIDSVDPFAPPEYGWDFGDGTKGSGMIVVHTYDTAGKYRVTLTIWDDRGNSDSTSKTIVVFNPSPTAGLTLVTLRPGLTSTPKPTAFNKPPVARFDYAYKKPVLNLTAAKSYDPDGTIVKYEWSMKNKKTNAVTDLGTGLSVKKTMTQAGIYEVTLKVTDGGKATDTYSETITITSV